MASATGTESGQSLTLCSLCVTRQHATCCSADFTGLAVSEIERSGLGPASVRAAKQGALKMG